jgi:hypothetical protein
MKNRAPGKARHGLDGKSSDSVAQIRKLEPISTVELSRASWDTLPSVPDGLNSTQEPLKLKPEKRVR